DNSNTSATGDKVDASAVQSVLEMFDDRKENVEVDVKDSEAAEVVSSPSTRSNPLETDGMRDKNNLASEEEDNDNDDGGFKSGTMTFMDEESAKNYQRILEEERRKQRRRQRRSWLEERRKSQTTPIHPKPAAAPTVSSRAAPKLPITVRSASDVETIGSADELPVDPLDPFGPSPSPAKRRRVVKNRISDHDDTDDAGALDKKAILDQRLRDRNSQQLPKVRYEQARINAKYRQYETDSDANASDRSGDRYQPNADSAPDMPETDSESEKPPVNNVFVIDDSSDDDFVSDPEEPLTNKRVGKSKPVSRPPNEKVARFFSSFERQRVKTPTRGPARQPTRIVKGYSDVLDKDLADFIVDDDDDDDFEEPGNVLDRASALSPRTGGRQLREAKEGLPVEFRQTDLSSSFRAYVQYLVYWICNDKKKPEVEEKFAKYFYRAYKYIERTISSIEQSLAVSSVCLRPPHPRNLCSNLDDDRLPDAEDLTTDFVIGRTCFQRAKVSHELHHYFLHLMYAVEGNLRTLPFEDKEETSIFISDSDGSDIDEPWGKTEPEELVQMLETEGRMEQLFIDYKDMLSRSKAGFAS
ncbi:hypothetical protein GGI15_004878, partial [Coemansia interrupta]